MTKTLMTKLRVFFKCTDSSDDNIPVSVRVDFDHFDLKMVDIVLSLVGLSPIMTLRFNKVTMLESFRRNHFKLKIKFEGA